MQGEPPFFMQPPVMMTVVMLVVMYFLILAPQKKAQKEKEGMLSKLDKNDEVIAVGGIHGTIVSLGEKTVMLRIADGVKIEVEKSAVYHVKKTKG
jgi:preprotein translocase subunit YajC